MGSPNDLGDKINTDDGEASASVRPDGKYLFFGRNLGNDKYETVEIFRVDTRIVQKMKSKLYRVFKSRLSLHLHCKIKEAYRLAKLECSVRPGGSFQVA